MTDLRRAVAELKKGGSLTLSNVPEGYDAFCIAELTHALAREAEKRAVVFVHVARDEQRARAFSEATAFASPAIEVLDFPAWDCQPYDRVSPNAGIAARRMTALARLARSRSSEERPRILSTTVAALLQRVPPLAKVAKDTFSAAPGNSIDIHALVGWLEINGFSRSSTVHDTGEYATRGGIVDLFAPALAEPIRLDFFGDTLETIRTFDPETQRTIGQLRGLDLMPMSEVQADGPRAIKRFRQTYTAAFGGQTRGDTLYEAISEGRRSPGLEHWLPLFYEQLDTIFTYTGDAPLILDNQIREVAIERLAQIEDYYEARKAKHESDTLHSSYKPLKPSTLYLDEGGLDEAPQGKMHRADQPAPAARDERPRRRCRRPRGAQFRAGTTGRFEERLRRHRRAYPRPARRDQARHPRRLVGRIARAACQRACRSRADRRAERVLLTPGQGPARQEDRACRLRPRTGLRQRRLRRHQRAGHPRRQAGAQAQVDQAQPPISLPRSAR